jgi:hypothetical protein
VKVEAMRGCSEVDVEEKKCTPVLVRVTAAPRPRLRTAVDVVAVLDVRSSMKGKMVDMSQDYDKNGEISSFTVNTD